jgi:hypothetical protein
MFTKLKVFLLIVCMLLITSTAMAAPFWQFHAGHQVKYNKTDSAPTPTAWVVTMDILHTDTACGKEYYHITQTNYDNDGVVQNMYLRMEETGGYRCVAGVEYKFFQPGKEGDTWVHNTEGGTRNYEIVAKLSSGTVYVVRSYDIIGAANQPAVYDYFVQGFGLVKEVDYQIANAPTKSVRQGFSGDTVYTTFPGYGLYTYDYDGTTTWTQINPTIPANMVVSGSNLYATFTGYGLFVWDGTIWTQINPTIPANMVVVGYNLYATFTGYGLYKWDGATWTQINPTIPANMVASGSALYATFTGYGLYKYDGSTWTYINSTVPASMIR